MATRINSRPLQIAFAAILALALLAFAVSGANARASRSHVHGAGKLLQTVRATTSSRHSSQSSTRLSIVSLTPTNGATLSGVVPWEVTTSGVRVSKVAFAIDGAVRSTDSSAPYTYAKPGIDTEALANGKHTLTAVAYGSEGRTASATISVTVSNATLPPPAAEVPPTPAPEPPPTPKPPPAPEPAAPAPEPAPQPVETPSSIYWGGWIGDQLTGGQAPWDMSAVTAFEKEAGKNLSVINFSAPFANCSSSPCSFYNFPTTEFDNIRGHGAIPFYSWGSQSIPVPSNLSEPNFQLSDVIAGTYDSYIRKFAEAAKAWGHPFFLRFNWEMNGGWFAWSEGVNGNKAGEYVAAWRHVHDIFTAVGATNATWVWCPNVDPENQMQNLASLYPGDKYVDWTGLDGYNWGTNPVRPDKWRTFDQLYGSTYKKITETIAPSKPMIISEVGSTEYGGSKATWIKEMLERIPIAYPKIRGLLWFENYADGMDWPIETSTSAVSAFAAGIKNPAYVGNQFGSLPFGPVQPATS